MKRIMKRLSLICASTLLCVSLVLLANLDKLPTYAQKTVNFETRNFQTTDDMENFGGTFTHRTVAVNGTQLHYVIGGHGDPVVLLHGWPETWYEWHHIMPTLAQHYTVIVPDLRGAGLSAKPPTGYDKRTMAEDIYGLIRSLGVGQINLVGHDIGGMVAYALAAAHPEAVRKFTILDVPLPGINLDDVVCQQRIWHILFHEDNELPEELVTGRERIYLSWFYRHFAYNPNAITKAEMERYVKSYSNPKSLHAGFEYYRAFGQDATQNQEYAKTKLTMPVLALGGDHSGGSFIVSQMQAVAENVQGGALENTGHWIAEEQPEELTRQLLQFFGKD